GAVCGVGDGDGPQPVLDGDGKRGALAQGTNEGVQRLSHGGHRGRDGEREALGPAYEVNPPVNVIRQQVTSGAGQLQQADATAHRARACDGGNEGRIAELAGHGEAVFGFACDDLRGPAPDPGDLASGEEAKQVEAVDAGVKQNPATALRAPVEPGERGRFESLAEVEGVQGPDLGHVRLDG